MRLVTRLNVGIVNSSVYNVRIVNKREQAIVHVVVYLQLCIVNSGVANVRIVTRVYAGIVKLSF